METNILPLKDKEWLYTYRNSNQISMQTGLIGYLRADMGTNGKDFFPTWNGFRDDLKTADFKAEFDDVINSLRESGGFLSNRDELSKYCCTDKVFAYSTGRDFGVRVDTRDYSYLMRLNPHQGEYNLYCYCYKKDWLDSHLKNATKGVRFITSKYDEKFRIPDGDMMRIIDEEGSFDYVCRYIDEYHFEFAGSVWHICQFAETQEFAGNKVIPMRSSLPEQCYVFIESENKIGIVNKGEMGYTDSKSGNGKPSENRALVDDMNRELGVTKAQAEAMKAGSMFGWETPAANPENYNEKGIHIKPKNKSYER